MSLTAGTRLGPYEILGLIGAGGMGEVYRAKDTRLGRSVAVKVLSPGAASDPERRARFEQEARAASSLNHPHICVLHDIGSTPLPQAGGELNVDYLVMEFLDGESLADRLTKGPLSLDEVLLYGVQIADAVATAHHQGIVHRDLKPANIMLTKTGAKLLDFGLAKLKGAAADQAATLSALATRASPATAEGMMLGTLAYMAPEQVEGRDVDARTDIFACGAVLFEMATGRRAFEARSAASVIAAILERDPPALATIEPTSPPLLDRLVRACLAKDPDARVQSARDLAMDLTWVREMGRTPAQPGNRRQAHPRSQPVPAVPQPVVRFAVDVPASRVVSAIALSPDGRALAYIGTEGGQRRIYLRRMDRSTDAPVAGTDGAGVSAIRFSPDGSWIGFFADLKVKRVPVTGGEPATIVHVPSAPVGRQAGQRSVFDVLDWAPDGAILFPAGSSGIWRLPPSADHPTRLTTSDAAHGEFGHTFPNLLPDGRHALLTIRTGMQYDAAPLVAVDIQTGQQQPIAPDGLAATCVGGGHLVYATGGLLLATRFDPIHLRVVGEPVPVVEPLGHHAGLPLFSVSRAGDLAYVHEAPPPPVLLVRLDRLGREEIVATLPPGADGAISLSPDGRRAALSRAASRQMSPWVIDLARGILEELPFERNAHSLVWLPDGLRLAFSSDCGGAANMFVRTARGNQASERLVESTQHQDPGSWSRDGRWLAYAEVSPLTSWDLWAYDTTTHTSSLFLRTDANERNPAISPSGCWLAYCSDRSGRDEVYVEAFPSGGQRVQVSGDGGAEPVWSNDGRELFYVSGNQLMRVEVKDGPEFDSDKPAVQFDVSGYLHATTFGPASYAVAPDDQTFYFVKQTPPPAEPTRIHVVLGWLEEFTRSLKRL